MLDSVALAHGLFKRGQIYDLSEARAKKMIERGLAKPIIAREDRVLPKRRTTSLPHGEKN